jgi:hypothetical protein
MSEWTPLVASLLAALGSIGAAVMAGRSASRTRTAQSQAERTFELEKRLAASKAEVYEPMVELLRSMFDSFRSNSPVDQQTMTETLSKFVAWLQIYGSDSAVRSFHKFMQASFHQAPTIVHLRLYAELVLAIRQDLGDPNTNVNTVELLGMRISDIHETFAPTLALDQAAFFAEEGWRPPWGETMGPAN